MGNSDVEDVLRAVTSRVELLRGVGADGVEKRELEQHLSVSRSTVDRGVRELLEAGLVERDGERVKLTLAGRLLLSEYDRFTDQVAGALEASDFLEAASTERWDIDPAVLEEAAIHRADRGAADPVEELASLVSGANHVSAVVSAAPHRRLIDSCRETVVEQRGSTSCVLTDDALAELTSTHRDCLRELLSTGRVSLARTPTDLSRSLVVVERDGGETMALVHHDGPAITGLLTNDSPEAVAWAREVHEEYRSSAHDVPNPFE